MVFGYFLMYIGEQIKCDRKKVKKTRKTMQKKKTNKRKESKECKKRIVIKKKASFESVQLFHTSIFFMFSTSIMRRLLGLGGASFRGIQLMVLSLLSFGLKLG